jgi:hypothetical protein
LIDDIQGRLWDVLYLDRPGGGAVPVQPRVLQRIIERYPAEWQIVHEPTGLRVLLSAIRGPIDDAELTEALRRVIVAQGAADLPIAIERVPELPKSPGGKIPFIRSAVPRRSISG